MVVLIYRIKQDFPSDTMAIKRIKEIAFGLDWKFICVEICMPL